MQVLYLFFWYPRQRSLTWQKLYRKWLNVFPSDTFRNLDCLLWRSFENCGQIKGFGRHQMCMSIAEQAKLLHFSFTRHASQVRLSKIRAPILSSQQYAFTPKLHKWLEEETRRGRSGGLNEIKSGAASLSGSQRLVFTVWMCCKIAWGIQGKRDDDYGNEQVLFLKD